MKIRISLILITLTLTTLILLALVPQSLADTVAFGDHIEMVCRDDGLVDVYHTILVTSNITANGTLEPNYSFKGTLVGGVSYEQDPEVHESKVFNSSKDGTSVISAKFNITLEPLKFIKIKLKYTVEGLLENVNGTLHFRHIFNTNYPFSTPEIVLKIPKPATFRKLVFEDTLPVPHLFMEESHYYVLVWKSSLFTFGNVSPTYIDVSYKTVCDEESIIWWLILGIVISVIGYVLSVICRQIKKIFVNKFKAYKKSTYVRGKALTGEPKMWESIFAEE